MKFKIAVYDRDYHEVRAYLYKEFASERVAEDWCNKIAIYNGVPSGYNYFIIEG